MPAPVERIGLTELYRPPKEETPTVDVIFVHGLFGHPKNSWTCRKGATSFKNGNGNELAEQGDEPPRKKARSDRDSENMEVFWPQDLLPQVMPEARIFTWGYDVQVGKMFSPASQASIFQHAATLLVDVATLRKSKIDATRPLIFVTHSLGGIVVKDALSLSRAERTFLSKVLPATAGVMFFGTPHRGSKAASLGKVAFELSKLFFQDPNLKVLRALEVNSEILDRISKSFSQVLFDGTLHVHSFQEELSEKGLQLVGSFSSVIGDAMETTGTIRASHRHMAKFSSVNDTPFKRAVGIFQQWEQAIQERNKEYGDLLPTKSQDAKAGHDPEIMPENEPDRIMYESSSRACIESLDVPVARQRLLNVGKAYYETYRWLFNGVGFEDWLEGKTESNVYWVRGKPGSGKSTLMKFALENEQTLHHLHENNHQNWVVAGFFFHDRGAMIQKSVETLLHEILYQILRARHDLLTFVYPIYYSQVLGRSRQDGSLSFSSNGWRPQDIEDALIAIATQTSVQVNLCLFIDALDEHGGDHGELLRIINRLVESTTGTFLLRLCLASRSENIFRDAFKACPGFAIHDMTKADIRQYAVGRIQPAITEELTPEVTVQLKELIEDLITKARGVFLWVRLVVQELIQGLREGDSIEELQAFLSTIPSELADLYKHAIRRNPMMAKYSEEAYVMFQLALCSRQPFRMDLFMQATSFLTSKTDQFHKLPGVSEAYMKRRLISRCAGLLEVAKEPKKDTEVSLSKVQFIHQTVKEFFARGGFAALYDDADVAIISQESGHALILKYLVYAFTYNAYWGVVPEVFYHARQIEISGGNIDLALFERLIVGRDQSKWLDNVEGILENVMMSEPIEMVASINSLHFGLLVIFIFRYLPLHLTKKLHADLSFVRRYGGALLMAAYWALDFYKDSKDGEVGDGLDIMKALVAAGVTAEHPGISLSKAGRRRLYGIMCRIET